jgi:hypothetical protein
MRRSIIEEVEDSIIYSNRVDRSAATAAAAAAAAAPCCGGGGVLVDK